MEDTRAEVNSLLPITFYRKEDSAPVDGSSRVWSREADRFTQRTCKVVKDLSQQDIDKKILIVQGGYGYGKTTLLRRLIEELGRGDDEFKGESLWFIKLSIYASLEHLFLFLADKAEGLGMRDASQILKKTTGELAGKKDAAFEVFYHCKALFIDDIDANSSFDFKFLSDIACKNLVIVVTCTDVLSNGLQANKIVQIPEETFYSAENLPILLLDISSEQTDIVQQLAEKLGSTFSYILIQSILHGVLTAKEALNLASQGDRGDKLIEKVFFKIFCKLPAQSQSILLNVAFIRTPLPVKDDKLFQFLLKLGLLRKSTFPDGKCVIQAPTCVIEILKKLERGKHSSLLKNAQQESSNTSLDLWMSLLPKILIDLINKAKDHTWPFIPEAWQYKDIIREEEKYNLNDVIHRQNVYADIGEIDILKECLFSALVEEDFKSASAVLFVIDRFIYWQGLSTTGVKVAEYIEQKSPETAIAPQVVIRRVRVMKNAGNIQGADKALNKFIDSKKKLGQWVFKEESDQQLVTSVCVQIRGDIYRGLGLWTRASIDLIKSIFGFKSLPKVDKKGWASSLSLLADAYQYMSMEDFNKTIRPRFNLTSSHPILEAIKCVNEAAQMSIYSPLFFTKNKRRAGELMLIYSRILPRNSNEAGFYLKYAATELIEGLKCHSSISSLQSREQLYEFVFCVYKLSQVLADLYGLRGSRDSSLNGTAKALLALALKLYEHYCSFELKIEHDDWSIMLIQTTMLLLGLPKLPLTENSKLPATESSDTSSSQKDNKEASISSNQRNDKEASIKSSQKADSKDVSKVRRCDDDDGDDYDDSNGERTDYGCFQNKSTIDTDEVDHRNAPTATDTAESDEEINYRQENTASSHRSLPSMSHCKEAESNTEPFDDKLLHSKSTVSTEEEGLIALKEELEKIRMFSRAKAGKDSQILMERKLVHNEILINEGSAEMKRQWIDKTNYVQNATTATDTNESTDHDNLEDEKRPGRFLSDSHLNENEDSGENEEGPSNKEHDEDEEFLRIVNSAVSGDSGVQDEEDDSGIEVFRNNTTYLTEEDYMSNENSKKRMKTTMATIEGTINTREQDVLQIENTLSVIRHSKAKVFRAKVWRYDPLTAEWSTSQSLAYIGEKLKLSDKDKGACRDAFMVEYINQEEPMAKYIGKQYKLEKYKDKPRTLQQYKQDVVCQVTSRYYATLFSQEMFRRGLAFGQVQFLPAVILELADVKNDPERYYNVEPYMAGNFTKISNNLSWVQKRNVAGKDLLLALSHFSYCASNGRRIIVDIQGWTSRDETGATFLTDPQIHTKDKKGFGTANRGREGFDEFWASQHPTCTDICIKLGLKRPKCST